MLERYCQALGLDIFNEGVYGPQAVFFESMVQMPDEGIIMTLDEAQEWLEIAPGAAGSLPG